MAVDPRLTTLRSVLRHLRAWEALYESDGMDSLKFPDGSEWSIWDVRAMLDTGMERLSLRQRQAIQFCLVEGMREVDVAEAMGVSLTNPVAMYASEGLRSLIRMMDDGTLPAFLGDK